MYAQIIVLTYQSPDVSSYTYEVPKILIGKIKVGQLANIPFGNRSPLGIVTTVNSQKPKKISSVKIKPVSSIISSQPILLPYQIELIKWMSAYYIAPMVNCLEAALPPLNIKDLKSNEINKARPWETEKPGLLPKQSLILVPTINQIPETLAKFPRAKNYAVYHNELKPGEKFAAWQKILAGKTDYIFGTRSAVFSPCPNLKEIVIYDDHDGAYKSERSPYFDTLTVAQKISQLTKSEIKIVDSSPKIATYFQLANRIKMQTINSKTKIVSMKNERLQGNFSPISSFVESKINKNLSALLFLNKIKESGSMFCKNCKFNDFFEKQPEFCPKCNSHDLYFNVLNIDSLKGELKKLTKNPNVEIQTATALYAPKIQKYDLIVYIQPDSLLKRIDFGSVETLFSQITKLKKLLKENGLLVIQTYNPDDETLKVLVNGKYQKYASDQLKNRHLLSYPPFALLIKLTVKGKNKQKVEKDARNIFEKLKLSFPKSNYQLPVTILGPFEPIFFSKTPIFNIIIKYKLSSYSLKERESAIEKITPALKEIRKLTQITVEPQSIN